MQPCLSHLRHLALAEVEATLAALPPPLHARARELPVSLERLPSAAWVKDGIAREVPVVTGETIGDLVEVKSGLAPGDKVVLKPGDKLADGARVKQVAK